MTMFATVFGDIRRKELLQCCERSRGNHFGAYRVFFELLEIPLSREMLAMAFAELVHIQDVAEWSVMELTARYPPGPAPFVSASPI